MLCCIMNVLQHNQVGGTLMRSQQQPHWSAGGGNMFVKSPSTYQHVEVRVLECLHVNKAAI